MKILLFNTFYYPKFVGGAEISVQLLAEQLLKVGHQVSVITIGERDEREIVNGVLVIRLRQRNIYSQYHQKYIGSLAKICWHLVDSCNPFYRRLLSKVIEEIKPDIVHTNNIQGFSPSVWRTIKRKGIPIIHTLRDYYLLCHRCNMFNNSTNCSSLCGACKLTHQIKRFYTKYPNVIVGVSRFILEKHKEYIKLLSHQEEHVIYNAVEISQYVKAEELNNQIYFGYMGRISDDKGVGYLIEEVLRVKDYYKGRFKLILAGKGDESYISQLKRKLGDVSFEFIGVVRPEYFYSQVDVCIVPSKWNEPFGRVVVEALAHATPVCLADSGGLSELHHAECTWLFRPKEEGLSKIISQIINDPQVIKDKRKYAQAYSQKFSVDVYIKRYQEIYEQQKLRLD